MQTHEKEKKAHVFQSMSAEYSILILEISKS